MTITQLREQYPRFIYHSFGAKLIQSTSDQSSCDLQIKFHFEIKPGLQFYPTIKINNLNPVLWQKFSSQYQNKWLFNLGMIEIFSYWKATASPVIEIRAGALDTKQLDWWRQLLIKGMGEYFYINKIDFTKQDWLKWELLGKQISQDEGQDKGLGNLRGKSLHNTAFKNAKRNQKKPQSRGQCLVPVKNQYLVPVGGGKDSALTLSLLKQHRLKYGVFLLNPTPAMTKIAKLAKPKQIITAKRQIDPKLLELNQQGYLNGHVPFSANLAFLASFVSQLFGYQSVLVSNERSSNEGNVDYLGQQINHQYSKTFEFEQGFNNYLHLCGLDDNLAVDNKPIKPDFLSLLRPLYELQISQLFASNPNFDQWAGVFKSCNRGQKTNTWCGECPKCLFTFASLYPFVSEKKIVSIFGQNLFNKPELINLALALLGKKETKPFECVGTTQESLVAFYLSYLSAGGLKLAEILELGVSAVKNKKQPPLLKKIWDQVLSKENNLEKRAAKILNSWNNQNLLDGQLSNILRQAMKNRLVLPPTIYSRTSRVTAKGLQLKKKAS
jgi:hypothetical protein